MIDPHRALLPLLLLLAQAPLGSQVPSTEVQNAWQAFVAEHGSSGWSVEWHKETGTPRAIYGRGLRLAAGPVASTTAARRLATRALDRFASLLGRGRSTFVEDIAAKMGRRFVFVYRQEFGGLEVLGGRADLRIHDSGVLSMIGSTAHPIPPGFDRTPTWSATRAETRARGYLRLRAANATHRLVIYPVDTTLRLAWEIRIDAMAQNRVGRVYVDARNGRVLHYANDLHECNHTPGGSAPCTHPTPRAATAKAASLRVLPTPNPGPMAGVSGEVKGWTNIGHKPGDPLSDVPLPRLKIEAIGVGRFYTDKDGKFSIATTKKDVGLEYFMAGRHIASIDVVHGTKLFDRIWYRVPTSGITHLFGSRLAHEYTRAQTTVYWNVDDVNVWTRGIVGNTRQLDTLSSCNATLNGTSRTCNAFYSRNQMFFYASSATCENSAYRSIILHEWGHGLDDAYGGLHTRDGLSEGNADIVATFRMDDPVIGRDFCKGTGSPCKTGKRYLRTALNTRRYPATGSVHDMGEVWMGCAWDVRGHLIATHGAAAGKKKAEEIVFATIVANARSLRGAVREMFLADDDDGDLCNGTPNYAHLEAACKSRGIPYPSIPCLPRAGYILGRGFGCRGTGTSRLCESSNSRATTVEPSPAIPGSGIYAMAGRIHASAPVGVEAFSIHSKSLDTKPTTVLCSLHRADSEGMPGALLRGPVPVTFDPTAAWKTATFTTPILLPPGMEFFVVVTNVGPTKIAPPVSASGFVSSGWHATAATGVFSGPHLLRWAWQLHCAPAPRAVPILSAVDAPRIGAEFTVQIHAARGATAAGLWFGVSDKVWAGRSLPYDLVSIGAPGCPMLVSWDLLMPLTTSPAGQAQLSLLLPLDPSITGTKFFNQAAVIDPGANPIGLVVSGSAAGTVGQ